LGGIVRKKSGVGFVWSIYTGGLVFTRRAKVCNTRLFFVGRDRAWRDEAWQGLMGILVQGNAAEYQYNHRLNYALRTHTKV